MGEKSKKQRGTAHFVSRPFRLAYFGKIFFLELLAIATTALLTGYMLRYVLDASSVISTGPWGRGIFWSTVGLAVALFGILFGLAYRISREITEAMARFEQVSEDVKRGNLSARVYLRDGDEMKALADVFNGMLNVTSQRIRQGERGRSGAETLDEKVKDLILAVANSDITANEKDKYRKILLGLRKRL